MCCMFALGVNDCINSPEIALDAGVPHEIVARGHEVGEMIRTNAPIRQFNRSSSVAYQRSCNEVAKRALTCDFTNTKAVRQLLDLTKQLLDPEATEKRK